MGTGNPTSRSGVAAHGSSCLKDMHVPTSAVGRSHKACVGGGPESIRRNSSCKITAGPSPKENK